MFMNIFEEISLMYKAYEETQESVEKYTNDITGIIDFHLRRQYQRGTLLIRFLHIDEHYEVMRFPFGGDYIVDKMLADVDAIANFYSFLGFKTEVEKGRSRSIRLSWNNAKKEE